MKHPAVTGIILAGGKSERMGRPKPLVTWRGRKLIEWVYDAIEPVCDEILIVANEGDFNFPEARVVKDTFPGMGPAAGIEAGLKASRNGTCLIVSCDTPMLSPALFRYLLDHHRNAEISLPVHEGKLEPLVGVYNRSAHEAFKRALENGIMSPREIIPACDWKEVGIGPLQEFYRDDLFLNLNTPQDLSQ